MAKAIIPSFMPIDATVDNTITFVYSGDQPYSNRLIIYDADSLEVVYDQTQTTMTLRHTIAANSLTNGTKYAASIICYDQYSTPSTISDKTYFWALATPTFVFANVVDRQVVDVSSFQAIINYSQSNGELINEYRFYIYDSVRAPLDNSEALYNRADISYVYKGLENKTAYFIRAQGVTERGIPLDTGYVEIFVSFANPENYANMYAEQSDGSGIVNYYTNFTAIDPSGEHTYYFENGYIILDDDTLLYDSNFMFGNNFSLAFKFKYDGAKDNLLRCYNTAGEEFAVHLVKGDEQMRVKLVVAGGYIQYSPALHPTPSDDIIVWVQREDNVFKLTTEVVGRSA